MSDSAARRASPPTLPAPPFTLLHAVPCCSYLKAIVRALFRTKSGFATHTAADDAPEDEVQAQPPMAEPQPDSECEHRAVLGQPPSNARRRAHAFANSACGLHARLLSS